MTLLIGYEMAFDIKFLLITVILNKNVVLYLIVSNWKFIDSNFFLS